MGDYLKRGAWTVCKFKGGLGKKEGGGVFEGGVDTPMHTMRGYIRKNKHQNKQGHKEKH